jgi:hypothetical protein
LSFVLLATYCYSIPIEPRPTHLTPEYEFTTGQTIVDRTDKINMHLVSSEEAGHLPNIHKERSVMFEDKDEYTTSHPFEHHDHMARAMDDPAYPTSTVRSTFAFPSSDETSVHDNLNKYFMTTMESSTQFHARAFKPEEDRSAESKRSEPEEDRPAESKRSESKEDKSAESKRSEPKEDRPAESKRSEREEDRSAESKRSEPKEDRPVESKRSEPEEDRPAESKRTEPEEDRPAESKRTEPEEDRPAESKRSESKEDRSAESKRSEPKEDRPAESKRSEREEDKSAESKRTEREEDKSAESKRTEREEDRSAESKRTEPEDDMKTTTEYSQDFTSTTYRNRKVAESRENSKEHPSSADSFSRMTGLLKEQTEETPKKYVDHSVEESTTRSSDKMSSDESTTRRTVHKITETEIVFPVEIIQTKVYGEKQPVVKTPKSDN